jgi:predicted nucleic acid-binding protein
MSAKVLVDSSFLVAQLDARDVHHQTAKALHELFRGRDVTYIYLDCMVNEAVTVLARRAVERRVDPRPILRRLRREIPADALDWTGPQLPRLWERALDTLEEHKGRLSFHDCLLVVVAAEAKIEWVASFDQSFDQVRGLKRIGTAAAFPREAT